MSIHKNFDGKGLTSSTRTFTSCRRLPVMFLAALVLCSTQASFAEPGVQAEGAKPNKNVWVHCGFEQFAQGRFEDGGSNLYVNAHGTIEMIHRWDVNDDGYVDLVLANSHDYIERGPTHIFKLNKAGDKSGGPKQLPNDSGWMSQIVDLDQDGFADLIVTNGENGVTSVLPSYVYWGGPTELGTERTDLPTVGAYDVAVIDINRDGRLDLIFPSAWTDHHNAGKPLPARVYLAGEDRQFEDATERYNIMGVASMAIAAADLNQDGYADLVVANYRFEHNYDTDSFVYWGTKVGLDVESPLRLPTHAALHLCVADLNHDAMDDIIFSGGNQVRIYWNRAGKFERADHQIIEISGATNLFGKGTVHCDVADMDGDGKNDLVIGAKNGVRIRSGGDLDKIQTALPLPHAQWVTAHDLNNDGRKDLIVSRYQKDSSYTAKSAVFWNGPGGFSTERATWFSTSGAAGNTAGDLDGDERPEVVFNNTMEGHVMGIPSYIYLGNKDAKYGIERRIELLVDSADTAAVADLDLDGHPEVILVAARYAEDEWKGCFRIYQGGPDGPTSDRFEDLVTNAAPQGVYVADFNRDGYLDLFEVTQVYDTKPETLAKSGAIHYGSKDGFSSSRKQPIEVYAAYAYVADVNKDGYLDLLCPEKRKRVLIYLGGEAGFAKDRTWKIPCPGLAVGGTINVADLNKDGWLDLIVATMGHYVGLKDTLYIYYGSDEGYSLKNSQRYLVVCQTRILG